MKKFLRFVVEFKSWLCLCFTAAMFFFLTISWIVGERTVEIVTLFQIFLLSLGTTLLQFIFFSGMFFKKTRYSLRLLLFALPMLALITGCAVGFGWVPVTSPGVWLIFLLSFLVSFAVICGGFEFYFHITGKKYDGLLGQYRASRERKP